MESTWIINIRHDAILSCIAAFVFVILGFVVGRLVEILIKRIFSKLRVNDVLIATGAQKVVEKAGYRMDTGRIVGIFFKWFIILIFVDMAFGILGFSLASALLYALVAAYLPHIIIAAIILFCGFVIAHRLERALSPTLQETYAPVFDRIISLMRNVIMTIAMLGVLIELHIAYEIALILFCGIVAACALAVGIALGFASKDTLARYFKSSIQPKE
jgi:hypothetical protein